MSLEKANLLIDLGRHADAERELRALLAADPDDARIHATLGFVLGRQRRWDEALAAADAAVRCDPTLSTGFYVQCLALSAMQRTDSALNSLRSALRLDAWCVEYYLQLAVLLWRAERLPEAILAVKHGLSLDPRDVGCLNLHASMLAAESRPTEAMQVIESALQIDPLDPGAHRAAGDAKLFQGQTEEALGHLLEAQRRDPTDSSFFDSLALGLGRKMEPFRTLSRFVPYWYRWPWGYSWLMFTGLMILYLDVNILVPPADGADERFSSRAAGVVGYIIAALILAPFTLDFAAWSCAQIIHRRLFDTKKSRIATVTVCLIVAILIQLLFPLFGFAPAQCMALLLTGSGYCLVIGHRSGFRPLRTNLAVFLALLCLVHAPLMLVALLRPFPVTKCIQESAVGLALAFAAGLFCIVIFPVRNWLKRLRSRPRTAIEEIVPHESSQGTDWSQ